MYSRADLGLTSKKTGLSTFCITGRRRFWRHTVICGCGCQACDMEKQGLRQTSSLRRYPQRSWCRLLGLKSVKRCCFSMFHESTRNSCCNVSPAPFSLSLPSQMSPSRFFLPHKEASLRLMHYISLHVLLLQSTRKKGRRYLTEVLFGTLNFAASVRYYEDVLCAQRETLVTGCVC